MSTTALEIAFPKTDSGSTLLTDQLPALPAAPVSTGLERVLNQPVVESKKALVCSALLQGDTLAKAQQDAAKLLPEMLQNTDVYLQYGTGALAGVNALIDKLLHEVEPTKIPELKELMNGLNDGMRDVQHKYDISQPEARKKFEKHGGGFFRRVFGKARTWLEMMMEDVTSIEHQLDKVAKELNGRQYQLTRNVTYYDSIYEENESEIGRVIYAIAVMELVRDLAAQQVKNMPDGDASLGDRSGEQKARIAEFASNMEIKIAEYKGRLFVAWSTSPQVRMMRTIDVSLAQKLNELVCVTIPTMKATILQWRMLAQAKESADMGELVGKASNDWLNSYAQAAATVVPAIAEAVQTPTLQPQTILAMADSIQKQAEGIIAALNTGEQRRAEMDSAILQAKGIIDGTADKVTDAVIEHVVAKATKPLDTVVATYDKTK